MRSTLWWRPYKKFQSNFANWWLKIKLFEPSFLYYICKENENMRWIVEEQAHNFKFWGNAKDIISIAISCGTYESVIKVLEEKFGKDGQLCTKEEINKYVSYDMPSEYPEFFGLDSEDDGLPELLNIDLANDRGVNEQIIIKKVDNLKQMIRASLMTDARDIAYLYRSYSAMEKWLKKTNRDAGDKSYIAVSKFMGSFSFA